MLHLSTTLMIKYKVFFNKFRKNHVIFKVLTCFAPFFAESMLFFARF